MWAITSMGRGKAKIRGEIHGSTFDSLIQEFARNRTNPRLQIGNHLRCESAGDESAEFAVPRWIEKDEPFRVAVVGGKHARAEGILIAHRPLDAVVIEDRPQIELGEGRTGERARI